MIERISDIVCLGAFNLGSTVLVITLTEVLSDFGLKVNIVPVHISFDEVHDGADVAGKKRDVNVLGDDRWYVHSVVLAELLKSNHFCLSNLRRGNSNLVVLSVVGLHLGDHQFGRLVVPIGCGIRLLVHSDVRVRVSGGTSAPTRLDLRSITVFYCIQK